MLVVGATGGVGQLVVAKLLEAGYSVRALARSPEKARDLLGTADALEIVTADLRDAAALDASGVASGVDAVVSCTGTTAFPPRVGRTATAREHRLRRHAKPRLGGQNRLPRARVSSSSHLSASSARTRCPSSSSTCSACSSTRAWARLRCAAAGCRTPSRPGRLTDGPYTSYDVNTLLRATSGTRRFAEVAAGDTLLPEETSRIVVADAAVAALTLASTVSGEYCVGTKEGEGPGSDAGKWDALFEAANANE